MEKRHNKYFTILIAVISLLMGGLAVLAPFRIRNEIPVAPGLAAVITPKLSVNENLVEFLSPDGSYILTVKNGGEVNGVITQTFTITNEEDKTPIEIFEKDSSLNNFITVPDNTFSPDNKYLFLKYDDLDKTRYIILRTDGVDIKKDNKTVEIENLFSEKYPDFVITDVTGWGGLGLIVVNTDDKNGKIGPSWWFDLSNFSFIRLSTRFN